MAKNILIFSDGTGQAGGLLPDERRTNVYKLFRATRCNPDTTIKPEEQLAFYDPGLGSKADGGGLNIGWLRWVYNLASQATGLGITKNIIDCYVAIIRMYEPGDRIYLFGFSRGAYTVRCLGGVLGLCGVPTQMPDGTPIKRDPKSVRTLASKAVKKIYQHGSGRASERFKKQRYLLAKKFRKEHKSGSDKAANIVPYFIGVWDTVASVGVRWFIWLVIFVAAVVAIAGLAWLASIIAPSIPFSLCFGIIAALIVIGVIITMLESRLRFATGIGINIFSTIHLTGRRMRFYDTSLNPAVRFAKHALSIDENRKDFGRVAWSDHGDRSNDDSWFEQIWFAGNHSDVGGSYPENESRLSDQALNWMVGKALSVSHPIEIDARFLNLAPSSAGPQHDERKSSRLPWAEGIRLIPNDARLHSSVLERFKAGKVLHFDELKRYRPSNLRTHNQVKKFYK